MKKIIFIILLLSAIGVFFSCGNKSPLENNLKYELVTFQKQSERCDTLRDDHCAKIKIEFPQVTSFENEIVKEKINKSIADLFSQDILGGSKSANFETMMKGFIDEYESFTKEFPDAYQSWFIERTGEVKLNKENILSIDYLEYSFTGGAHPNTFVLFKNYNLENGEEIKLEEIISADKQQELSSIAETEFRKLKELTPGDDLGQAGYWFENNKFYLNDNFLITDSTLVFYYNSYEITAYAFGPTELEIPYSKIKPLTGENSLLKGLIE
jgi:Deacetylase PdaC/Protein of unknown function (DUF3298)